MPSSLTLEKVDDSRLWDAFVQRSPQGTCFSLSCVLSSINTRHAEYFCCKGSEVRAGVCVIETEGGESTKLHDFIIYNGVVFAPPAHRQNMAQIHSERFQFTDFIVNELSERYQEVHMRLAPSIHDIRPFLWYNYGATWPRYAVDVRYTSYVSIEDFQYARQLESISLFNQCSSARRQEIRYAIRQGVVTREEFDAETFVRFYKMTFIRQNIQVDQTHLVLMRSFLCALQEAKIGRMFVSYTKNGDPGSMTFFGTDNKRAYFIFGANHPDYRNAHTGTAALWDAFGALSRSGVPEVDLEGVNSPKRGWFKLSFGGDLRTYYQLCKEDK